MARVLIDVSAAGEAWFKTILPELVDCKNVKFVYSDNEKYRNEVAKNFSLGKLLKLMKDKGRREDTDPALCSRLIGQLVVEQKWIEEDACDDPHIFAIAYQKPDVFVFTSDKRLVACQSSMRNTIDKRFRAFSTVQSQNNYDDNVGRIKAS